MVLVAGAFVENQLFPATHGGGGPDEGLVNIGGDRDALLVGEVLLGKLEAHVGASVARLERHLELLRLLRLEDLHVDREGLLQVQLRYSSRHLCFDDLDLLGRAQVRLGRLFLVFGHVLVHLKPLAELFHVVLQLVVPPLQLLDLVDIVCVAALPTPGGRRLVFLGGAFISGVAPAAVDPLADAEGAHLALKGPHLVVEVLILKLKLPNDVAGLVGHHRGRLQGHPLRQLRALLVKQGDQVSKRGLPLRRDVRPDLFRDAVEEFQREGLDLQAYLDVSEQPHVLIGVARPAPPYLDGVLQLVLLLLLLLLVNRAEPVAELEAPVPTEQVVQVVVGTVEHGVPVDPRGQPVRKLRQRPQIGVEGVEVLEFHSTGWQGLQRDI